MLAQWERGEREPGSAFLGRVNRFLTEAGRAPTYGESGRADGHNADCGE